MPGQACGMCGLVADPLTDGDPPLGWTAQVDPSGRPGWVCPACTREHVRAIEAKLDQNWW